MQFRHEWKHLLNPSDQIILRQRLSAVLQRDRHAIHGAYQIRSLYFDDPYDSALREKLDGVNVREKFRIRYYNNDPSLIHLEKKSKQNGLGRKDSVCMTEAEVRMLCEGKTDFMQDGDRPLLSELYVKMKTKGLSPKTIVDYTREPFVFPAGNVRVTLDHHIRTALFRTDLFSEDLITIPVPDDPILLEVKWDGFLPDLIRDLVRIDGRRTSAFSKYALCRTYD